MAVTAPPRASAHAARYAAFLSLSYSRAADGRLAPSLQSGLQRFAKPWYRLRILRVFRDDASLSANPGLWTSIANALDNSDHFVLLASPAAVQSPWVSRELAHWLELGRLDRLMIVLTDGEIVWTDDAGDFDWKRTTALPPVLAGVFTEVPRFTDLRWVRTRDHVALRDSRFLEAVADLAAPLHGRPKDELFGADVRQHRRTRHITQAAVAALVLLTATAIIGGLSAVRGRAQARDQRDRAEAQARLATSRGLAAASTDALELRDPSLGLLLAARAVRFDHTPEAMGSLFGSLNAVPRVQRILELPRASGTVLSGDGAAVASTTTDGKLEVRSLTRGAAPTRYPAPRDVGGLGVGNHGQLAAIADGEGGVTIYDATRKGGPERFPGPQGGVGEEGPFQGTSFAVADDRRLVAWNGADVSVWNGHQRFTLPAGGLPGALRLAISHDGRVLAAGSDSVGTLFVWHLGADGRPLGDPIIAEAGAGNGYLGFGKGVASLAVSPDGKRVATGGFDGTVAFWDAETGRRVQEGPKGRGTVSVAFSPDGRRLVAAADDRFRLWDVSAGRVRRSFDVFGWGSSATFLKDSRRLVTTVKGGVAIWDPAAPSLPFARHLAGPTTDVSRIVFSPNGKLLATLSYTAVRLWNATTLRPVGSPLDRGTSVDIAFSRDSKTLARFGSFPQRARVWDAATHKLRAAAPAGDAVAATRSGWIGIGTDARGLSLWDIDRRARTRTLGDSKDTGGPIEISPEGSRVVASVNNGANLRMWNANSGRVIGKDLPGAAVEGTRFTADGRMLVTANHDGAVRTWRTSDGRQIGAISEADGAFEIGLGRGGSLATLSLDRLELWDVPEHRAAASQPVATRQSTKGDPFLEFSPDGHQLAAVDLEPEPLMLDLDPQHLIALACRVAGRDLTSAEWEKFVGNGFSYTETCP